MRVPKSSPQFRLTRAPVGSGDRVKRCLSEGAAPRIFQSGRRCVETSGDVTENAFTAFAKICRALSPANHCKTMPYVRGMYFCRPRISPLWELKRDLH